MTSIRTQTHEVDVTLSAHGFDYRFRTGEADAGPPLLLLHGTGGSEHDLLPLADEIRPGAPVLSPRGQVSEGGMARFFRRHREGVFDFADVRRRAADLAAFVRDGCAAHSLAPPVAVGFSNGANIAAALLYLHPQVLAGAVLLRAMVPLPDPPAGRLDDKPVLLLSGAHDRMIPLDQAHLLAEQLSTAGARVEHRIHPATGHGLVAGDIEAIREWLAED